MSMSQFTATHLQALEQLTQPGAPFEITEHLQDGVSFKSFKNAETSLSALMRSGRDFGEQLFVEYGEQQLNFAQFFDAVDRLTAALQQQFNLAKGERVAIAMRNRPEWLIAFVAIINAGAVVVPLNSWGKQEELQQGLTDSAAVLLICDAERYQFADAENHGMRSILVDGREGHAPTAHWQALLNAADPSAAMTAITAPDDSAILLFTSGTSGRPKGALFSHFNCCQALMNIELIGATTYMTNMEAMNTQLAAGHPPKTLLAVPLFHISGLFSQFVINLRHGRGLYMMYKWDADEALRLIKQSGITVVMGAPTMLLDLLDRPDFTADDALAISNMSAGGAATPRSLHALYHEKAPKTLAGAGWGLTESGGSGAAVTGYFLSERPGTSGFPSPIVDFSFRDENGANCAPGEVGEIWIKSATCITRYVSGDSDGSDFEDGWFKTGDMGYLCDEGMLYVVGRAKDLIIRGGENIYPAEIEHCLMTLPQCIEAAVIGLPSEHWGEEVAAVLLMAPGAEWTAEQIRRFTSENLAGFKVPEYICFADEPLPRNALNKLLKREIRERYFPAH